MIEIRSNGLTARACAPVDAFNERISITVERDADGSVIYETELRVDDCDADIVSVIVSALNEAIRAAQNLWMH